MKKRQTALQSAPLYAKLIVDEWNSRLSANFADGIRYYQFIHDHGRHPAYRLALKKMEKRA